MQIGEIILDNDDTYVKRFEKQGVIKKDCL